MGRGLVRRVVVLCAFVAACGDSPSTAPPNGMAPPEAVDWRDEVIYQIVTDRFANADPAGDGDIDITKGKAWHGGDFAGVIAQIPYLQDLGVTAVWISPHVKQAKARAVSGAAGAGGAAAIGETGYHGYWPEDLTDTDPHFGDRASFKKMIEALHAVGIKVIADITPNHVGPVFYYDLNGNGAEDPGEDYPAFTKGGVQKVGGGGAAPLGWRTLPKPEIFANPDMYHRMGGIQAPGGFDDPDQSLYGDFPGGLRDLATEKPEVRAALVDAYAQWIADVGLDGFRIDTVKHVETDFWVEFATGIRQRAKAAGKRHFFQFGEAYEGDDRRLGLYTKPGALDAVFYFSQKFMVIDGVFKHGGPTSKVPELLALRSNHGALPQPDGIDVAPRDALVGFIDTPDLPRFLSEQPSKGALRSALGYLLTWDGVPCIYYGTEQELAGGADPGNREDLWLTGYARTSDTYVLLQKLVRVRRTLEPLRRGDITVKWASDRVGDEEDAHVLAFERRYEGDTVLVVINASDQERKTGAPKLGFGPMKTSFAEGSKLRDALLESDERFTVGVGGALLMELPPRAIRILVPEAKAAPTKSPDRP